MFWVSAANTTKGTPVLTITPNERLNRELRRWVRGMSDDVTLNWVISEEIQAGNLSPRVSRRVIKKIALASY